MAKAAQTPAQRHKVNQSLVKELQTLLKDVPVEVLGYIESAASCCGNGTVALVKIDRGERVTRPARQTKAT